jgi:hypothetical protein
MEANVSQVFRCVWEWFQDSAVPSPLQGDQPREVMRVVSQVTGVVAEPTEIRLLKLEI